MNMNKLKKDINMYVEVRRSTHVYCMKCYKSYEEYGLNKCNICGSMEKGDCMDVCRALNRSYKIICRFISIVKNKIKK